MRYVKIIMFYSAILSVLFGQNSLTIVRDNGEQLVVPVSQINTITFPKDQTGAVFIDQSENSPMQVKLTQIEKIVFDDAATIINESKVDQPHSFLLHQNYPNPFNPGTTISYELEKAQYVTVSILNVRGQQIRHLLDADSAPGLHHVIWDGTDQRGFRVSSGVYFYKVTAGQSVQLKKCLLIE